MTESIEIIEAKIPTEVGVKNAIKWEKTPTSEVLDNILCDD